MVFARVGHYFMIKNICGGDMYLVISEDKLPHFTGIALYIISSTNTTENFKIA